MANKQQSKDIAQLLKLLAIEENLGDIEPGDLVFFAPRKLSIHYVSARIIEGPNRWRDVGITVRSRPDYSDIVMFLETDAWRMKFLRAETIIEVDTKDFGSLWTIKKIAQ